VTRQVPSALPTSVPTFEGRPLHDPTEPVFDQGLAFDVETLLDRRQLLKAFGYGGLGLSLLALVGCGNGAAGSGAAGTSSTSTSASAASTASASASAAAGASAADCAVIPEETAGPFPGDGSNGPDILTESGVVRKDIRASLGSTTTVAQGIPLTIRLAIQDQANNCTPLGGAAVYVWHCDRDGNYSMYSSGVENETYLRGVQAVDANGVATFTSIFPACYPGRWPHVHFEVYKSLEKATNPANRIATSQIALPEAACQQVYGTDGYRNSLSTLSQVTLKSDIVFANDGGVHQIGTMTGSVADGLTVDLAVPVSTA